METNRKLIASIAVLALIACAGIGAYCLSDSGQQATDNGNEVEFYPTDGTVLVLGTYMGNVPIGEHFSGWSLTASYLMKKQK